MPTVKFPYGKTYLQADFDESHFSGVLESHLQEYIPDKSEDELVETALDNPIGSDKLSKLAEGKKKVVIICSDHTRPVPSRFIIPKMLKQIRQENPDADITLLIATGFHRHTSKDELISKFGEEIVEKEKIVVHESEKDEDMVYLGKLPSGGDLLINKIAYEADLLCAEGFIEPHFFAGYSGGRKSVLPGVASRKTVLANHCSEFIDSPKARTGLIEDNPIHKDMLYASKSAKLSFICNVIINAEKKIVYAVAGDPDKAHHEGVSFLDRYCKVSSPDSDIVISTNGGYPLDQNIYQSVKGMTAAEAAVRKDGVIIMLASCADGHGGQSFYDTFANGASLDDMYNQIMSRKKDETIADQWESQILIRILKHAHVIFVSDQPDEMIENFRMIPAHSLDEALTKAHQLVGTDAKISAIPDGVSLIVTGKEE